MHSTLKLIKQEQLCSLQELLALLPRFTCILQLSECVHGRRVR